MRYGTSAQCFQKLPILVEDKSDSKLWTIQYISIYIYIYWNKFTLKKKKTKKIDTS